MKRLTAWFSGRSNSKQRPQNSTPTVERLETRDVPSAATLAVANGIVRSQENFNDFVTFEYNHLLRRAPDQNGLNHWVFEMQTGMSPEQVEAGFASSAEYISDHGNDPAAFVTGLYNDLLGRAPDSSGFNNWLASLQTGTSPLDVALGFARSPERESMVIRQDYADFLGRLARNDEIAAWLSVFQQGANRADVATSFVNSDEFFADAGRDPTTFIVHAYQDVLARTPSQGEVNFWLNVYNGLPH
jgi:Domain of unknown function (DUF4214)